MSGLQWRKVSSLPLASESSNLEHQIICVRLNILSFCRSYVIEAISTLGIKHIGNAALERMWKLATPDIWVLHKNQQLMQEMIQMFGEHPQKEEIERLTKEREVKLKVSGRWRGNGAISSSRS